MLLLDLRLHAGREQQLGERHGSDGRVDLTLKGAWATGYGTVSDTITDTITLTEAAATPTKLPIPAPSKLPIPAPSKLPIPAPSSLPIPVPSKLPILALAGCRFGLYLWSSLTGETSCRSLSGGLVIAIPVGRLIKKKAVPSYLENPFISTSTADRRPTKLPIRRC